MKFYFQLFVFFLAVSALSANAQQQKNEEICYNPNLVKDTSKKSIKSMAVAVINGDSIKINYHSPGVRKRVIWGGLVPYNEVWVTGAHDATTFEIGKSFIVGGKEIPAGKYAIFTIPGKNEWTVIINKQWKQHLATEYDEKEDVVRIKVKPKKNVHTERLQYFIEPAKGNDLKLAMAWEKIRIEFSIKIK
ncbi:MULTISPECIES: DUF2911 domain-containing protein [Hydrotalea]|uniref:DUF2911 domain-containing protein n=1 Tax=Hydrotalea TaxID=1004300 RepID=UPI000834061F|nr:MULTISPECIES: DUF2911 domain-containing protein [Hydrotalea]RTL53358.1 MAG: DUF2911 domain-containing protein [Sphingobacteriales bacterium]RWZ83909.1 MAG: DUF2911 domain-containing protein [Hydrotalea sp. AMD]